MPISVGPHYFMLPTEGGGSSLESEIPGEFQKCQQSELRGNKEHSVGRKDNFTLVVSVLNICAAGRTKYFSCRNKIFFYVKSLLY